MQKLILKLLMVVLLVGGCANNKPVQPQPPQKPPQVKHQEEPRVSDYFPLVPNRTYTYQGEGNEYASKVITVEYLKGRIIQLNTNNGGTQLAEVFTVGQGAIKKVFSKGESYWREDFTEARNKNDILLQEPLKVGTEWNSEGKKYRIAAMNAKVSVPYGTYEAIKVTTELEDGLFARYFVKDIGIIKEEYTSGGNVIKSELTEIIDQPTKISVEVSYPDDQQIKLTSVKIDTELVTNQSLAEKLFNLLRTPKAQGVVAAIPKGTKFLSYKREDNAIRLNFSKEYLNDPTMGAEGEQLKIQALTNTFAKAFGVEGIILNIEGKAYESGHNAYGVNEIIPAT